MTIVAGVDFGTLSVRVSIVDSRLGLLCSALSEYPLHQKRDDPDYSTQSHDDHMRALVEATHRALNAANISGEQIAAAALDTTDSSVIPVGVAHQPLRRRVFGYIPSVLTTDPRVTFLNSLTRPVQCVVAPARGAADFKCLSKNSALAA